MIASQEMRMAAIYSGILISCDAIMANHLEVISPPNLLDFLMTKS
ncbi:hypothetical protein PSY30_23575 [Shigella flexneri]|nr:hypothetical protein [Shigella flexneri]